jgi:CBS domain-containing protein
MRAITAADLMNPEVLSVPENMTIRELARFLTDNQITGAPVEDTSGKLIGVVSVVDIAAMASDEGNVTTDRSSPDFYVRGWEDKIAPEEIRDFRVDNENLTVAEIMTPAVFSVTEDATVSEVASMMLRGHLHRLLVTRDQRPIGIVSTSDLLGLFVDESVA